MEMLEDDEVDTDKMESISEAVESEEKAPNSTVQKVKVEAMELEPDNIKSEPLMEAPAIHELPVKIKMETEVTEDLNFAGAEAGWASLTTAQPDNSTLTPGRLSFAQVCAKNSNSPVISVKTEPKDDETEEIDSYFTSPEKKGRKRSLFPEGPRGKESFGILDEQNIDSPSKDIREIMTNIHMDSPMKQDENEDTTSTRRSSPRKAVLLKSRELRDALKSPNKDKSDSRKRTRESSKTQDSPATKMAHLS